ncbi:glycoside-pentoside-hexuronide (GPH):cation symporter [Paraglaciecola sp. L3A3]|uniref:glycoside-pentoside-hexuronide (GPH):cation symporter n=1 Tax=Paraglaciecola sp. L3A3 TaxID=2686358 RepID=UPI001E3C5937|nr:glycoside-pentoside-hexuronide (GPH):cation symporter [Paraglaciecola sp. L3A3]
MSTVSKMSEMPLSNASSASGTINTKEKLAYGMGDTAANIVFQVVINFMMYFYTDVYGIEAAAVGTLFLVVRLFDAFTDPIMGGIADRTRTRWGRYRPYLLWMSLPYGILAIMAFSTPDLSTSGKLVYAYVTYALLMLFYTATNIPYSALGGVMSSSTRERASIQSYRFALAMIGGAVVTASIMPMVEWLGQGDEQKGFQLAMIVLAALAVLCFIICFYFTRERVEPESTEINTSVWADVLLISKNDQWRIIALITLLLLVSVAMKGGVTPYYVEYYLGQPDMVSIFMTSGMLAGVAGALFSNWASKRMCKIKVMKLATIGIIIFNGLLAIIPGEFYWMALGVAVLANFVHMIFVPLLFSTVPDTVDYGAKKFGRSAMAMSFSGQLLALKFGIALGGAFTGWLLAFYGYQPNVTQTDNALFGIVFIFSISTVLAGFAMIAVLHRYKLTDGYETRI